MRATPCRPRRRRPSRASQRPVLRGVLEVLVFAVLDPADMRWFGGELVGWSAQAVYTLAFLAFWAVIALASSLTLLLAVLPADEVKPARRAPGWPR